MTSHQGVKCSGRRAWPPARAILAIRLLRAGSVPKEIAVRCKVAITDVFWLRRQWRLNGINQPRAPLRRIVGRL